MVCGRIWEQLSGLLVVEEIRLSHSWDGFPPKFRHPFDGIFAIYFEMVEIQWLANQIDYAESPADGQECFLQARDKILGIQKKCSEWDMKGIQRITEHLSANLLVKWKRFCMSENECDESLDQPLMRQLKIQNDDVAAAMASLVLISENFKKQMDDLMDLK